MPQEVITQSEKQAQDAGAGCFLLLLLVLLLPLIYFPLLVVVAPTMAAYQTADALLLSHGVHPTITMIINIAASIVVCLIALALVILPFSLASRFLPRWMNAALSFLYGFFSTVVYEFNAYSLPFAKDMYVITDPVNVYCAAVGYGLLTLIVYLFMSKKKA